MREPCASTVAAINPSTISEKYSAGRISARLRKGWGEQRDDHGRDASGENEPIARTERGPARPYRAIW